MSGGGGNKKGVIDLSRDKLSVQQTADLVEAYSAVVGMAWYTPEAWKQLAAMPEAKIEKSYEDYVRAFERGVRELARRGARVERIVVDVAKMTEWCHKNGYEIDHKGRATYSSMLMLARDDPRVLDRPVVDRTRTTQ